MKQEDEFPKDQLSALISLIDDPDEQIYNQIRQKIISLGESVIPQLESYWETENFGDLFQLRIEDIIHEIQFSSVQLALKKWISEGGEDLLEGMIILNRYQYPDLDELELRDEISKIRQDIWLELNDHLTAFEQIKVINHILFEVHGFRGNKKNYHSPQNSFLNQVLHLKKGNPLSLSILYLILAERLDIPMHGVNLPHHFILAYEDRFDIFRETDTANAEKQILFYLDPFSKGTILSKAEIIRFLKRQKLEPEEHYFAPCDNRVMILRSIHNLIFAYQHAGDESKVEEMKVLLRIFE